jgi:hypothetical protein
VLPGVNFYKFDFVNAFNTMERPVFINQVRRTMPELSPFVTWSYGQPADLLLRVESGAYVVIESVRGVRQGDPLGPLLFSLGLKDVLMEFHAQLRERYFGAQAMPSTNGEKGVRAEWADSLVLAYLDDVFALVRDAADEAFALECITRLARAIGLVINLRKSAAVTSEDRHVVEVLGAHFGPVELCVAVLNEAVDAMRPLLEELLEWRRHVALLVLRHCYFPKLAHLARTDLPEVTAEPLRRFAELVFQSVQQIAGIPGSLSAWQRDLVTLPMELGGLGFVLLRLHEVRIPFAASLILSHAELRLTRGIRLELSAIPQASEAVTEGAIYLPGAPTVDMLKWHVDECSKLTHRMAERYHATVLWKIVHNVLQHRSAVSEFWMVQLLEHMTQLSSAWLTVIPYCTFQVMSDAAVMAGLQVRLLAPPAPQLNDACVCINCGAIMVGDAQFSAEACELTVSTGFPSDAARSVPELEPEDVRGPQSHEVTAGRVVRLRDRIAEAGPQLASRHARVCPQLAGIKLRIHNRVCFALRLALARSGAMVGGVGRTGVKKQEYDILVMPDRSAGAAAVLGKGRDPGPTMWDVSVVTLGGLWLGDFLAAAVDSERLNPTGDVVSESLFKALDAGLRAAQKVAFEPIANAIRFKRHKHAPAEVLPFVVSIGGGIFDATERHIPMSVHPTHGRHIERQNVMMALLDGEADYRARAVGDQARNAIGRPGAGAMAS